MYIQNLKLLNIIGKNYESVKKESFGQKEWSSEGRKITQNITTFEKTNDNLIRGVEYIKENSLDENNEKIIVKIKELLDKSKATAIPQIQAIKEKTKYFDSNFEMDRAEENNNNLPQQQEVVMDLMNNKEVLEQRRKELEGIHKTAAMLKDTTDQMAKDVHQQGIMLDDIENQVQNAHDNAVKAKKEISDANDMSKGNSKKLCCLIAIVMITVGVIVAIILSLYFSFK